jgi:hypothetical protein
MSVFWPQGNGSWHWLIPHERDGDGAHGQHTWACVPEVLSAWHTWAGGHHPDIYGDQYRINDYSLGVEIVNWLDGVDPYSEWQVRVVADLVRYAWSKYPDLVDVFGHAVVQSWPDTPEEHKRTDPGANFPWEQFKQMVLRQRDYPPVRAETLPRAFEPQLSVWTGGGLYTTDQNLLEYALGHGSGSFVYRLHVPAFAPELAEASITAVLTSASDHVPSDVTLFVNGQAQQTKRVPAASAASSVGDTAWIVPAQALKPGQDNVIEFKVPALQPNGVRVIFRQSGSSAGEPVRVTVPPQAESSGPLANDSAFVVQNVPLTMAPGSKHRVVVEMRNIGAKTWMPGKHRLGSEAPKDNLLWGPSRVELSAPVPPGGSVAFAFDVTAPLAQGQHAFRWKMLEERVEWFGPGSPLTQVTVSATSPPAPPIRSTLRVGETMVRGTELTSENRHYKLVFQDDGNIVLYGVSPQRVLWATYRRGAVTFTLQSDGNLVAYDAQGRPAWDSQTRGSGATMLIVQSDGNMVLYRDDGRAVWNTGTAGR